MGCSGLGNGSLIRFLRTVGKNAEILSFKCSSLSVGVGEVWDYWSREGVVAKVGCRALGNGKFDKPP